MNQVLDNLKVKKFTVILGDREKYENTKNQGVAGKGLVCIFPS